MINIVYEPSEVFQFFKDNEDALGSNMIKIAENLDNGVEVFISAAEKNGNPIPLCEVYLDDDEIYTDIGFDEIDTEVMVSQIYERFIYGFGAMNALTPQEPEVEPEPEPEPDGNEMENDMIYERETELDSIVYETVFDILGYSIDGMEEAETVYAEVKEMLCQILAAHGVPVFRPMYVETENGTVFEEYPYLDPSEMLVT